MRTSTWIGVVLTAWLAWSAVGVFPAAPLEGDGSTIGLIAHQWAERGPAALEEAYRYEMQSGTYLSLMLIDRLLGVDAFTAFSALSAVAAVAFILLAARWIKGLTSLSLPACGLLMMLFQETWTSAFYPNSTVLAGALVMLSFSLLTGARDVRRLIAGGVVFGLACWTRFDAVVLALVVPFLVAPDGPKRVLRQTVVVGTAAAVTALVAMHASGASLPAVMGAYLRHRVMAGSWGLTLRSWLSLFSLVTLFLLVLGARQMARDRQWREAILVLLGFLPAVLLLRTSLTTPKYLLYLTPFAALVAAHGVVLLKQTASRRRWTLAGTAAALFAVQYPLGFQIEYTRGYHPQPHPTLLRFGDIRVDRGPVKEVTAVAGAGATMSTHDAVRLSSGIFFANWTWRHYKLESAQTAEAVADYLACSPSSSVGIWVEEPYEARLLVAHALLRAGYSLHGASLHRSPAWQKNGRQLRVFCGQTGLESAEAYGTSRPLLALVMWNDQLPPSLRNRFPDARRLTKENTGHHVYLLKEVAPSRG